jgi:hypothetical protein
MPAHATGVGCIGATASQIAFVCRQCVLDRQGLGVGRIGIAASNLLRGFRGFVIGQIARPSDFSKSSAHAKALVQYCPWPLAAFTTHVPAVRFLR